FAEPLQRARAGALPELIAGRSAGLRYPDCFPPPGPRHPVPRDIGCRRAAEIPSVWNSSDWAWELRALETDASGARSGLAAVRCVRRYRPQPWTRASAVISGAIEHGMNAFFRTSNFAFGFRRTPAGE